MDDRADEASPAVDLETHVRDVVRLLEDRDLRNVALVGHSYGGLVTTGAADRVPGRVSRLVYVDTGPLPDGVSQNDFTSPEEQRVNADAVTAYGAGWQLPPPPWAQLAEGVAGVDPVPVLRHMGGELWTYVELPTWHWPMLSRPAELADALDATCGP